jgi:hypothetical protein
MSRIALLSSLLALSLHAQGQKDALHIREENEHTRIALTDILGEWVWEHTDSTLTCAVLPEVVCSNARAQVVDPVAAPVSPRKFRIGVTFSPD